MILFVYSASCQEPELVVIESYLSFYSLHKIALSRLSQTKRFIIAYLLRLVSASKQFLHEGEFASDLLIRNGKVRGSWKICQEDVRWADGL